LGTANGLKLPRGHDALSQEKRKEGVPWLRIFNDPFYPKGIENIKESARLDPSNKHKAMGAEMKAFYLVMGQYDGVVIVDAPNDEVMAKLSLAGGTRGTVRTETLRAFTEEEYRKIIAALP
jgi:uncharacterized protein with GYD domain